MVWCFGNDSLEKDTLCATNTFGRCLLLIRRPKKLQNGAHLGLCPHTPHRSRVRQPNLSGSLAPKIYWMKRYGGCAKCQKKKLARHHSGKHKQERFWPTLPWSQSRFLSSSNRSWKR